MEVILYQSHIESHVYKAKNESLFSHDNIIENTMR